MADTESKDINQPQVFEFQAGEADVNELFAIVAAAKELHKIIRKHEELKPYKLSYELDKNVDMKTEETQGEIKEIKGGMKLLSWWFSGNASQYTVEPAKYILKQLKAPISKDKNAPVKVIPGAVMLEYSGIPKERFTLFTPGAQLDPRTQGPNSVLFEKNASGRQASVPRPRWDIDPEAVEILPAEEIPEEVIRKWLTEFLAEHARAS